MGFMLLVVLILKTDMVQQFALPRENGKNQKYAKLHKTRQLALF